MQGTDLSQTVEAVLSRLAPVRESIDRKRRWLVFAVCVVASVLSVLNLVVMVSQQDQYSLVPAIMIVGVFPAAALVIHLDPGLGDHDLRAVVGMLWLVTALAVGLNGSLAVVFVFPVLLATFLVFDLRPSVAVSIAGMAAALTLGDLGGHLPRAMLLRTAFAACFMVVVLGFAKYAFARLVHVIEEATEYLKSHIRSLSADVLGAEQRAAMMEDMAITALTALAQERDSETGDHIGRTRCYVRELALALRAAGRYVDELPDDVIDALCKVAPLHDIGKVSIPDSILRKAGRLTEDEFEIMKTHAAAGERVIERARTGMHLDSRKLRYAQEIAGGHHERWDGAGYPRGLRGQEIPLSARLMAVADAYDALVHARPYKPAWSHADATAFIRERRGSHFDPDVVDAFVRCEDQFRQIAR